MVEDTCELAIFDRVTCCPLQKFPLPSGMTGGGSIMTFREEARPDLTLSAVSPDGNRVMLPRPYDERIEIWRRHRPEWWWGVFSMLEFWFSTVFAAALVWSLLADKACFARMDAEAARARENRSRPAAPLSETP
jgi:hypothetical protein